jgi:hypothetical protein
MKVVNEDKVPITTKVVVKQLHYMHIIPRLKWLFLSEETSKQMRWHKLGKCESKYSDTMLHLANGQAWRALDHFDSEFAGDPRSAHLGLLTDGFQSYSTDSSLYSSWLVFVMPYNVPPNKSLKQGFTFLALIIPLRNRRSK